MANMDAAVFALESSTKPAKAATQTTKEAVETAEQAAEAALFLLRVAEPAFRIKIILPLEVGVVAAACETDKVLEDGKAITIRLILTKMRTLQEHLQPQ